MSRVHHPHSRSSFHLVVLTACVALLGVLASACEGPSPASPWGGSDQVTVRAANGKGGGGGGGGGDPVVSAVDPDTAQQGITLDLTISGDNFELGSVVDWLIAGTPSADVQTNSTTFVNKKRLIANVTVADAAPTVLYDARVTTLRGRRGVGSELLEVKPKGPVDPTASLRVQLTPGFDLSDDDGDPIAIVPYVDGQAGTTAGILGSNNWQLQIRIFKDESTRQFCYDLSGYTSLFPGVLPADLPFDATGFNGCVGGSLFTRDHSLPDGFVGMDSGDPALSTMLAGGPFRLDDPDDEGWIYLLTFGHHNEDAPECVQNVPGGSAEGEGFLITMTAGKGDDLSAPRRWTIEPNPAAQVDAVLWRFIDRRNSPKGGRQRPECIAVFDDFSFFAELIEIGN